MGGVGAALWVLCVGCDSLGTGIEAQSVKAKMSSKSVRLLKSMFGLAVHGGQST